MVRRQLSSLTIDLFRLYDIGMAGRPKKTDRERRDSILQVRLTATERATLDAAAASRALDTSAWVRSEALALAAQMLAKKAK